MQKIITWGFAITISLYALLHYITYFFPLEPLLISLSISGLCIVFFSGIYLPLNKFILSLLLIISAVVIQMVTNGITVELLMEGIREMRSLIALLLIVPIISFVLKEEPYIEEIMSTAHHILNTSRKFYFGLMILTQVITYFLLFGSISMVYQFINGFLGNQKGEAWENFKGTALLRSFSLTTLWVISIPSFVFAVDHLGASLGIAILQGFAISLTGIILAVIFSYFQEKKYGVNITEGIQKEVKRVVNNSRDPGKWNHEVIEFIFLFISLFGTIFVLQFVFGWELLIIIPPTIVVWTCIYFLVKKKKDRFLERSKVYFASEVVKNSQQYSLLLSAGLLIFSVNQSGIGDYIIDSIFYITDIFPFLNFLFILPFVVIGLGFLGLGPLTVIVLVSGIVGNISLPYPPELVVLSITSGSVISILLSPLILPVIVLSSSNGLSVVKNGFKFNFMYTIFFYIIVQAYLQIMVHFVY